MVNLMVDKYVNKAKELFSNKKYNKAIKFCDKSIRQDPHDINAFIVKINILNTLSDIDVVFDCFNQGLLLNPDSESLWICRADYEFNINLEEALNSCNKALEINDNNPYTYFLKANILAKSFRFDDAWDVVDLISNKFPDTEYIYHLKAVLLYVEYNDLDIALEYINKFLKIHSDNDMALKLKNDIIKSLNGD